MPPLSWDDGGGGIPDAPADGISYGRKDNDWTRVVNSTGDTLQGLYNFVTLPTTFNTGITLHADTLAVPPFATSAFLEFSTNNTSGYKFNYTSNGQLDLLSFNSSGVITGQINFGDSIVETLGGKTQNTQDGAYTRLDTAKTISNIISPPLTATSAGNAGNIAFDNSFFYVCIATDIWVRSPLTTW